MLNNFKWKIQIRNRSNDRNTCKAVTTRVNRSASGTVFRLQKQNTIWTNWTWTSWLHPITLETNCNEKCTGRPGWLPWWRHAIYSLERELQQTCPWSTFGFCEIVDTLDIGNRARIGISYLKHSCDTRAHPTYYLNNWWTNKVLLKVKKSSLWIHSGGIQGSLSESRKHTIHQNEARLRRSSTHISGRFNTKQSKWWKLQCENCMYINRTASWTCNSVTLTEQYNAATSIQFNIIIQM